MYMMTCIRPDLAYPLSLLARYVAPSRHRKVHWDAAKRVLRYLCSTSGMGLVLGGRDRVVLIGHAYATWVDDSATQRSSQGYTFSLGSGSVCWRSTSSSSVLRFSCEAEIYAGAMAAQVLRWLTYLLTDLGEQPRLPPSLYVDNKAMIALCQEHRLEHRTKHIALQYFLARELQQRGQLRLAYVVTRANTADVFTKALPPGDHQCFSTVLSLLALLFLTGLSDAARVIIEVWLLMVERESGKRVKAICSDCGGEFLGAEFRSWLKRHGIKQQLTTAYTPQSNGVAERANRTIIEGGRTILVDSGLPLRFWPLAIRHATVIKNRVLTHVGAAAVWAVHLGLARGSKGWLMWDPKSNTIFTTRDAKFMEGLMFKEWSERGRSKVTIPLGIEVGTNDQFLIPIELSSSSELTEVSHDLGGVEGEAADAEGVLQQGEAPVAERGDNEEEVQQPTPSPKLLPWRTTQGKRDVVRGGAKEGAAKERPKRAAHPRDFLKYERLGVPKAMLVQEEEGEGSRGGDGVDLLFWRQLTP
ncbi:unnamed protein product [Closterium sp. NIES-53]